jgi:hypothetical protein
LVPITHPEDITTFFPIATLSASFAVGWINADGSIPLSVNSGVKNFLRIVKKAFSGESTSMYVISFLDLENPVLTIIAEAFVVEKNLS